MDEDAAATFGGGPLLGSIEFMGMVSAYYDLAFEAQIHARATTNFRMIDPYKTDGNTNTKMRCQ